MKLIYSSMATLCLSLFPFVGLAQQQERPGQVAEKEVFLSKPTVERNGTEFTIRYSITLGEWVKSCTVQLFLSIDGGGYYPLEPLRGVSGDVGTITQSGNKAAIYKIPDRDLVKLAERQLVFIVEVTEKKMKREAKAERTETKYGKKGDKTRRFITAGLIQFRPTVNYDLAVGSVGWGAMAGMTPDRILGFYIKGSSDFGSPLQNSPTAAPRVRTSSFSAGFVGDFPKNFFLLCGLGLHTFNMQLTRTLYEFGMAYTYNHYFLSAIVGTTFSGDVMVELGIGLYF